MEASGDGRITLLVVAALVEALSLPSSASCEALFVAMLSDEADTDAEDSSVLLLFCGDTAPAGIVDTLCCDVLVEDSMLVIDGDPLE